MKIELPYPPSVNHYWRHVGRKVLISRDGRTYRQDVNKICNDNKIKKQTGRLAVTLLAYPPDRRRRDLDNLPKALLDALKDAGAYEDDSQIDDLRITRKAIVVGGKIEVTIKKMRKA